MIAVLADDLTGAAELAAVGLRHGLTAEVHTSLDQSGRTDLLSFDADSRGGSAEEARGRVRSALGPLRQWAPKFIYKKVDSVLRGHVLAELEIILSATPCQRIILVPANPTLGRIIRNGRYFIHGRPVNETDFRNDPSYPRHSAELLEMLGASPSLPVRVCRSNEALPERGIIVGEAESPADLRAWATRLDETTSAAGGAEFFAAILEETGHPRRLAEPSLDHVRSFPQIFVCGSPSESTRQFLEHARNRSLPVSSMPESLVQADSTSKNGGERWLSQIVQAVDENSQSVVAIDCRKPLGAGGAARLAERLIDAMEALLRVRRVGHICVEGGATASALIRRLGWNRMAVLEEWAQGAVSMKPSAPESPILTMKPGSYRWPETLVQLSQGGTLGNQP